MDEPKMDLGKDPGIDGSTLVSRVRKWNKEDKSRASSAAETRGEIGKYLEEEPRVHKKALADIRKLDKMDEDKRADYLRSWHRLLAVFEQEWGQGQGDLFAGLEPDPPNDPAERLAKANEEKAKTAKASRERTTKTKGQRAKRKDEQKAEAAEPRPDPDSAEFDDPTPSPEPEKTGDPDFDKHAEETFGSKVVGIR